MGKIKTEFTIFKPDGTSEKRSAELEPEPGYHALKAIIEPILDNQPLEHVAVLHDGRRADMFVDENGPTRGLPRNEAATKIYRNNWLKQHPETRPEELSAIYGTAVLFSRRVWF